MTLESLKLRNIVQLSAALIAVWTMGIIAQNQTAPKPEPASSGQQVRFKVIEVEGKPRWSKVGVLSTDKTGWQPVKVGDAFGLGIQIHTAVRTKVKLVMDPPTPPTILMIEASTLASIDDLLKPADRSAVARLGLAYGAIRAGVAESDVRSDLEIQAPVATLSKRGTWGFRMFVERGTGRWEMSLAERGLLLARNNLGQSRFVHPGQFVNQMMSRWIESVRFNRPVFVQDLFGLKGSDLTFFLTQSDGLGVLIPGGNQLNVFSEAGRDRLPLRGASLSDLFGGGPNGISQSTQQLRLSRALQGRLSNRGPIRLNDGDFGVGFGFVPINVNQQNERMKSFIGNAIRAAGRR